MRSTRMKHTSPPRKRRRVIRREKPRRGTVPLLLALCVMVVGLVLFAPQVEVTPAANLSGTEIDEAAASSGNTDLKITEVMSSNRSAYPDEEGSFPDWVELTNTGDSVLDLTDYGLSDRADKITFVFPAMTLDPGERIIVFASDENRNTAGPAAARQVQDFLFRRHALSLWKRWRRL